MNLFYKNNIMGDVSKDRSHKGGIIIKYKILSFQTIIHVIKYILVLYLNYRKF